MDQPEIDPVIGEIGRSWKLFRTPSGAECFGVVRWYRPSEPLASLARALFDPARPDGAAETLRSQIEMQLRAIPSVGTSPDAA